MVAPEEWSSGSFNGLTARGGYTVSAEWENKKIKAVTVTAKKDGELHLFLGEGYSSSILRDGFIDYTIKSQETVTFRI